MRDPIRIGLLGASRIATDAIITPERVLGHTLAGVATRDSSRAAGFAAEHEIETAHGTYEELIVDPSIDLIYNSVINSAHAEWNIAALEAGRHVLSEKPMTGNAAATEQVIYTARKTGSFLIEGFHYIHHPIHERMEEVVRSGLLGESTGVHSRLNIPAPPESDPRWDFELSGGVTMDIGCYVLDAMRHTAAWMGTNVEVTWAEASVKSPKMDAGMTAELQFSTGVAARCEWNMAATDRDMTWTVEGARGESRQPPLPFLTLTQHSSSRSTERLKWRVSPATLPTPTSSGG